MTANAKYLAKSTETNKIYVVWQFSCALAKEASENSI